MPIFADPVSELLDARRWTREQAESLVGLLRETPLALHFNVGPTVWADQPAAVTPLFGRAAGAGGIEVDLRRYGQVRLSTVVTVAGVAGAALSLRLAPAAPLVAASYANVLVQVPIADAGFLRGGWIDIPVPFRAIGFVDVFGAGGNGAADPTIGTTIAWFR